MCKKGPPAVWTKEKIEEAFAGFVEKNRRLPVAREMKPQYGLPTRRTFERYMDMTAQEYAELRYPTLLSARDERHVQTVLEYRNEVREWSIERLMEAEKNFFTKCGRLPEPYEYTAENGLPILFTQPGMRYCQAQALVHSLLKDEQFSALSEYDKTQITGRILEEVRGRMMEDIVLLETMKAADKDHRVFKLQFEAGEFDMVIYDQKENCCEIFEIKHSSKQVPLQYRHLVDEDKCQRTERRFGPIQGRYILYRGEDVQMENGVQYWNVENYLKALPTLDIVQAQETGTQSIEPTM